ncbi:MULTISPECIES: thioesterase II family protein [Pelosinus]|jgi:surfactin synthase thioesterase subunit|uniref:Thioesterase n=2 Tax=Pelosinus fermentans TaxID=365349 RepID=I8TT48_9FIRM|nr:MULTISPECIES: alpha/beta fold hydrolase [Pelosinus]AJQ28945.1 Thioesterase [Pelosinus fermentans JBW45]EIW16348.1 Thioesterase [Pelosinus fermentans B4]EIW22672.1 Thioesterase [Pelosinus fermentans A11]OAM95655.1 Thioesterase [Pelosinus fermentans DSM 17108]SDR31143.1 Surfactin synthase thioesterase subunit [Pelosinus fermentans]
MKITNNWFPFARNRDIKKTNRVFCFHYAGGSSSIFKHWAVSRLPVEFIPVELPGRGARISESCLENFDCLIEQMISSLITVIDNRPFYFFGHSMGAMIAFEAAYQLQGKYGVQPEKLIVAGRHAPHRPDLSLFKSHMSDETLIWELKRLNGTPREILENREIIQFLLPMIRSDYKLHESYNYQGQKLSIPIIAHAGKHDHEANAAVMQHWQQVTDGAFAIKEFDGNHFFVQNLGEEYLSELIRAVSQADYNVREA